MEASEAESLLASLPGLHGAERAAAEARLAAVQRSVSVLAAARSSWLFASGRPDAQFYAAQAICAACASAESFEVGAWALEVSRGAAPLPRHVAAKLRQAAAAAAVSLAARGDSAPLQSLLCDTAVLAEIPPAADAFSQHADAREAVRVRDALAQAVPVVLAHLGGSAGPAALGAFGAWSASSALFAADAASSPLIGRLVESAVHDSECAECLLAWLEADKALEAGRLASLLPLFLALGRASLDPSVDVSAARAVRLYAEQITADLAAGATVARMSTSAVLSEMANLTLRRPDADMVSFWGALFEAMAARSPSPEDEGIVRDALGLLATSLPRSEWRASAHAAGAAMRAAPAAVWSLLAEGLRAAQPRVRAWTLAVLPEAAGSASPTDAIGCAAADSMLPHLYGGPCGADEFAAIACLAPLASSGVRTAAAQAILASSCTLGAAGDAALAALAKKTCELDDALLQAAPRLGREVWPAICAAALRRGAAGVIAQRAIGSDGLLLPDGPALLNALLDAAPVSSALLEDANVSRALSLLFALRPSEHSPVTQAWETALAKAGPPPGRDAMLALARPLLEGAVCAPHLASASALEAAVIAAPDALAQWAFCGLVSSVLSSSGCVDDERLVAAAPVLDRSLLLVQRGGANLDCLQPHLGAIVSASLWRLCDAPGNSSHLVSDDVVRAAARISARAPLPESDDGLFSSLLGAVGASLAEAHAEVLAPVLLRMLAAAPVRRARLLEAGARLRGAPEGTVRVLLGCRLPRRFAELLLAAYRPGRL